jgi:isopentenyl-diphosphate delta-isomerase
MSQHNLDNNIENDPTSDQRKEDHISLAFQSQTPISQMDDRFYYEPMLSGHPDGQANLKCNFIGQKMNAPLWVSSMTGGTAKASLINKNLGKAVGEYGLGMGLGSCRGILFSDEYFSDFDIRKLVGDQPLYANLGIAQVEELVTQNKTNLIEELVKKLQANGLIIHVNPLQEWLQPEGDRYFQSPIDTIKKLCDNLSINIIVKEVGQGFGIDSLRALLALPIQAIDFAAHGGTNFSTIELGRADKDQSTLYYPLTQIGHSANAMVDMMNGLKQQHNKEVIISGGIKNYLDGYYLINKCKCPAIYGQASQFLKHAMGDYEDLQAYIEGQLDGLNMAYSFLTVKS